MSARDRSAARVAAAEADCLTEFDDIGAIVTAMRHMLTGGAPLGARDAAHLYVLAVMAEAAWRRLDDAMTGSGR